MLEEGRQLAGIGLLLVVTRLTIFGLKLLTAEVESLIGGDHCGGVISQFL